MRIVLALYLQQGRGMSAIQSGLVFTILALAYVVASAQAPSLGERYGRRLLAAGCWLLAAGCWLLAAGCWLLAAGRWCTGAGGRARSLAGGDRGVGVGGSIVPLIPGLMLIGAGMGVVIVPLTSTIMSGVAPEQAGAVSGTLSRMQNVGGALGVAVTGVIFFGALHGGYAHALELSLAELAALLLTVASLTRLLPAHRRAA